MHTTTLLTTREIQVIGLIERSYSNQQIANTLAISIRTVETHRKNIFKKTDCHNALALVKWAYANKVLQVFGS
jgi:DNA-binding CsgD family transcriptional regulator